jgi:hypothetical protein
VKNRGESQDDSRVELPNPELNPLLNPTLGRHLGLWAQAYFTSPPEKREQAVGDLLRQLQGEEPDLARKEVGVVTQAPEQIRCTACGYWNASFQRYCGMCGAPLPQAEEQTGPDQSVERDTRHAVAPAVLPLVFEPAPAALESSPLESSARTEDQANHQDLDWLRARTALSDDVAERTSGGAWKYAAAAVIALGLAWLGMQWATSRSAAGPSRGAAPAAVSVPAATQSAEPAAVPAASVTPPESAKTTGATKAEVPAAHEPVQQLTERESNRREVVPARTTIKESTNGPNYSAGSSPAPPTGGGEELAQAERYLEGRDVTRDPSEAAKWLWRAVGKQNPTASLLLADLYAKGEGVSRNCEQARLLATAAVRKGTPGASEKLQSLAGCQ